MQTWLAGSCAVFFGIFASSSAHNPEVCTADSVDAGCKSREEPGSSMLQKRFSKTQTAAGLSLHDGADEIFLHNADPDAEAAERVGKIPLNEEGFATIQKECCYLTFDLYSRRVIASIGLEICDAGCFNGFIPFFYCGKAPTLENYTQNIIQKTHDRCACFMPTGQCPAGGLRQECWESNTGVPNPAFHRRRTCKFETTKTTTSLSSGNENMTGVTATTKTTTVRVSTTKTNTATLPPLLDPLPEVSTTITAATSTTTTSQLQVSTTTKAVTATTKTVTEHVSTTTEAVTATTKTVTVHVSTTTEAVTSTTTTTTTTATAEKNITEVSTTAPVNNSRFVQLVAGESCTSDKQVITAALCSEAAQELGLSDTSVSAAVRKDRPKCYCESFNSKCDNLYYNAYGCGFVDGSYTCEETSLPQPSGNGGAATCASNERGQRCYLPVCHN